jgi:organic hydroperoxide reductase OsmC/OhrA
MESQYTYSIKASSTCVRSGIVGTDEIQPPIAFSAPPEFQGQAGNWTPEHFFVAAVAACFVSTLSGMASVSKFDFLSLKLAAEGIIRKDEGGWRFTQVNLRPRLSIALEKDRERASRLLEKAGKICLVARSLTCPVALDPEIVVEQVSVDPETKTSSVPLRS